MYLQGSNMAVAVALEQTCRESGTLAGPALYRE